MPEFFEETEARREAGWIEYRRLVISELERIGRDIKEIENKIERLRVEDISSVKTDVLLLKFQASLWGTVAGLFSGALLTLLVNIIPKLFK